MFAPLLVAPPPPPSVSHAPFCSFICFQRMMTEGPGIRASGIVRMLMCPKAEKGASSVSLVGL